MSTKRQVTAALTRARKLIDSPDKWTRGAFAIDDEGNEVDERSKRATCFCSYGAIGRATRSDVVMAGANERMREAARKLGFNSPITLNDNTDHATVMKMFDIAIGLS